MDEPTNAADSIAPRIRASFGKQGLMRLLGAHLSSIEPGVVAIRLPNRPEISQQHGYIHAGAVSAIADTAGGYAALTLLPDGCEVLTVEFKINLLAPAVGDLLATGTVLRPGRTLTVCRFEVMSQLGNERTIVAAGQQTLFAAAPKD